MPDKAWKKFERWICAAFGGKRSGPLGKEESDCIGTHPWAIEAKHRQKYPKWLHDMMDQAVINAKKGETPLLALHEHGADYEDSLVVFRFRDIWWLLSREAKQDF